MCKWLCGLLTLNLSVTDPSVVPVNHVVTVWLVFFEVPDFHGGYVPVCIPLEMYDDLSFPTSLAWTGMQNQSTFNMHFLMVKTIDVLFFQVFISHCCFGFSLTHHSLGILPKGGAGMEVLSVSNMHMWIFFILTQVWNCVTHSFLEWGLEALCLPTL